MYVDTVIEMCPPEVFQGLAKEGMEKADDRLQCSNTYTLSGFVLSLSNLTGGVRHEIRPIRMRHL